MRAPSSSLFVSCRRRDEKRFRLRKNCAREFDSRRLRTPNANEMPVAQVKVNL